jgi:3-methyladenine DNA glycosylase AlkD
MGTARKKTNKKTGSRTAPAGERLTLAQAMAQLEQAGTAQNVKVYRRHGVKGDLFGVSYANLGKLKKRIKVDHELAVALWNTGNHDARVLATMIADPASLTASELDRWAREVDSHVIADAFGTLASRSAHAVSRYRKWAPSKKELTCRCGFSTLAHGLSGAIEHDADLLSDAIADIEARIHEAPNRAREGMNLALIAIGTYSDAHYDEALGAAKRIGVVEIDHGETGCKTFEAVGYIKKAAAHREKKARKG